MKKTSLLIILLSLTLLSNAQDISHATILVSPPKHTSLFIIQIDNFNFVSENCVINTKEIQKVILATPAELKEKYSQYHVMMALKVSVKPNTTFLNFNQILQHFNIDDKYKNYKVAIEESEVSNTSDLIFSKNYIDKVIIYPDQQILDFITINYKSTLESRELAKAEHLKVQELIKERGLKFNQ